jgi:outer membrane protein
MVLLYRTRIMAIGRGEAIKSVMNKRIYLIPFLFSLIIAFPLCAQPKTYSLKECIGLALRNSYLIRQSRESISLSEAQNLLGYSEMLPYVGAQSSVTRSSSTFGVDPYADMYATSISARQTVFDLPTLFNIRSSRSKVKERIALHEAALNSVEYTVAGYFYDLLSKRWFLEVRNLAFMEGEENLRKSQLMYDVGTISKIDLLRAEVAKNQSELDLLTAEKDLSLSKANLAYLIGIDPREDFDLKEDSAAVTEFRSSDYDSLLRQVLERNPEIIAERLSVSSGKDQLRAAYVSYVPTVSISGSYGYSGDKFTMDREEWDAHDSWSAGVSISLPLFTGFSRAANIKQTRASLTTQEIGLDDVIAQKEIDLKKALLTIDEAQLAFVLAEKNLEKAELSYRMVQEKYTLGAATIIELIDAERDYEQAQVSYISSYFDKVLASIAVSHLLGERIGEKL